MKNLTLLLLALPVLACGDKDDTSLAASQLWYQTCGDPACKSYSGPFDGVPSCAESGITAGADCTTAEQTCDPVDDCNALLLCTDEDPTQQPGGCPVSRKKHKHDIRYLSPEDLAEAGSQALSVPLARWRYNWEDDTTPPHLGFLIDDVPGSPAVRPDGEHVDLYGYTSLALAAIQSQQVQIAAQQVELVALQQQLIALQQQLEVVQKANP